jgi:hypothetical protein
MSILRAWYEIHPAQKSGRPIVSHFTFLFGDFMRNTLSIPLFWGGGTPFKPDRQSLLRLMQPVLFLLMLMTGNFALATGLNLTVTGNIDGVESVAGVAGAGSVGITPATANFTVFPVAPVSTATNCVAATTGSTCTSPGATGAVTLTATFAATTFRYVIWGGDCAKLTPTYTNTTSAITVNVPSTGAALNCSASFPATFVYDASVSTPQPPLGPNSCINFGYTAVGATPAPVKTFGVGTVATTPSAISSNFVPSPDNIFQLGSTSGLAPLPDAPTIAAITIPTASATTGPVIDEYPVAPDFGSFNVTLQCPNFTTNVTLYSIRTYTECIRYQ